MAKKGKKPSTSRSRSPKRTAKKKPPAGPVVDPEAESPDVAPGPGISSFEKDRLHRIIGDEIQNRGLETEEEINALLAEFSGRSIDEILDAHAMTPEEEARRVLEENEETEDVEEIIDTCVEALEKDPHCIEAKMTLALAASESIEEAILRIKTAIVEHEDYWGREYMEEHRGHFWGVVDTRPYMMARAQLVQLYGIAGFFVLAAREAEEMLELNPSDNQGIRDPLRGFYLALNRLDALKALNAKYEDGAFATPAWSVALGLFLEGKQKQAEKAAAKAHAANPHVLDLLAGRKAPPEERPAMYSLGSPEEAYLCAENLAGACIEHPDLAEWLEGLKGLGEKKAGKRKRK